MFCLCVFYFFQAVVDSYVTVEDVVHHNIVFYQSGRTFLGVYGTCSLARQS